MTKKELDFNEATGGTPDETAIVPVEPQEVVTLSNVAYTNAPTFQLEDLALGRLRLIHGISPEATQGVARPGEWYMDGLPPMKQATIVPLRMAKLLRRVAVDDATKPWKEQQRLGYACYRHEGPIDEDCPNCRWQFDPVISKTPKWGSAPEDAFSYMIYLVEYGLPGILEFARSAMQAAKMMNTFIHTRGLGNVAFRLTTITQNTPRGASYFVPSPALADVPQETLEVARALIGQE